MQVTREKICERKCEYRSKAKTKKEKQENLRSINEKIILQQALAQQTGYITASFASESDVPQRHLFSLELPLLQCS